MLYCYALKNYTGSDYLQPRGIDGQGSRRHQAIAHTCQKKFEEALGLTLSPVACRLSPVPCLLLPVATHLKCEV
jgi:hypothetical protein